MGWWLGKQGSMFQGSGAGKPDLKFLIEKDGSLNFNFGHLYQKHTKSYN